MENLFVLPTDKPSRLQLQMNGKYHLENSQTIALKSFHNICITDDSEIKDGEYGLSRLGEIIKFHSGYDYRYYAKIILTTDQDLIKDGVQAIPDDFLEWFVKNPSCDSVDIKTFRNPNGKIVCYKITIPQEEPKEFDIRELNRLDDIEIEEMSNDWATMSQQIKPKQETLEEVAERILANNIDGLRDALQDDDLFFFYKGVIQCYGEAMVEWQAERMYSEEEFIVMINEIVEKHCTYFEQKHKDTVKLEWFEQFKKK
jgi:hypothetical protein